MTDLAPVREVQSRLLSAKKDTRLVLCRSAEGLRHGEVVRSTDRLWRVQGRIVGTGDVVLAPA